MILKDYLTKYNKDDILSTIESLYPDSDRQSYSDAWDEMIETEPAESDGTIICVKRVITDYDNPELEIDDYIDVHGENPNTPESDELGFKRKGREIHWAIEFSSWDKWLGWEVENSVDIDDPRCDTVEKLLANILWEMTFCGYTNKEVQGESDFIKDRVDEIDKWEAEGTLDDHLIPLNDVMEKMNKLIGNDDD